MAEIEVNGGVVVHELLGPPDGDVVVITPGGRFSKDFPGVKPFAQGLADGGKRVLIWDRPNCGASDVQLFGRSESHMRAETLKGLLDGLGIERAAICGGSGGARDSMVFTILYPEKVSRLAVWSVVGGTYSSMSLAMVYVLGELRTVRSKGIEGVLTMPGLAGSWADLIEANPRNRDRLLALGSAGFEKVMNRWLDAYVPKPNEPIPGVPDHEIEQIDVPTLIVRGGKQDFDHPARTSFELHTLITGSRLVEPPWPEDAWERAGEAREAGTGNIFDPWMHAVPLLLDFLEGKEAGTATTVAWNRG